MASKIKLYDETGVILQYTFPLVQDCNAHEGGDTKSIIHTSPRGKGAVIIDGGEEAWELYVRGILYGEDYEAVIAAIEDMKSKIQKNTPYVLKMEKTDVTFYERNVKLIQAITFPVDQRTRMTKTQEYTVTFLANSW